MLTPGLPLPLPRYPCVQSLLLAALVRSGCWLEPGMQQRLDWRLAGPSEREMEQVGVPAGQGGRGVGAAVLRWGNGIDAAALH